MDRPQPVSAELERDLERIRQLNRWFGSYRLVLGFIRRWLRPGARVRIVDLATGSGDIPRLIADYARKIGAQIEIDALDRQPATLEVATKLSTDYPEIYYRETDILEWDPAGTYDIVLCTLALHHFSDEDAVRVLRRCRELSRKFVLVSDLRRGFLLQTGVYLLTELIFREPMTRHDARLSAERAFSFTEMRDLALARRLAKFWSQEISIRAPGHLARSSVTHAVPVCHSERSRLPGCSVVRRLGGISGSRSMINSRSAMRIITTVAEAQSLERPKRRVLVPTMGALHKAHGELIRVAREHAGSDGEVAVSIFVNPLQFEPGSDYERYPRRKKLMKNFVEITVSIFVPSQCRGNVCGRSFGVCG